MRFGGLSEQEVENIKIILEKDNVSFKIVVDGEVVSSNKDLMESNLRHFHGANISTHILAIEIEDNSFAKISASSKQELLHFGITDIVPSFGETIEEVVHKLENKEKKPQFFEKWGYRFIFFIVIMLLISFALTLYKETTSTNLF